MVDQEFGEIKRCAGINCNCTMCMSLYYHASYFLRFWYSTDSDIYLCVNMDSLAKYGLVIRGNNAFIWALPGHNRQNHKALFFFIGKVDLKYFCFSYKSNRGVTEKVIMHWISNYSGTQHGLIWDFRVWRPPGLCASLQWHFSGLHILWRGQPLVGRRYSLCYYPSRNFR